MWGKRSQLFGSATVSIVDSHTVLNFLSPCTLSIVFISIAHLSSTMPDGIGPQKPPGADRIAITGIGILCPAVIWDETEVAEELSCCIEIQSGDPLTESKLSMACMVKPNDWTEVSIDPPLVLPCGSTKGFAIKAEVNLPWLTRKFTGWANQWPRLDAAGKLWPRREERIAATRHTFAIPTNPSNVWRSRDGFLWSETDSFRPQRSADRETIISSGWLEIFGFNRNCDYPQFITFNLQK